MEFWKDRWLAEQTAGQPGGLQLIKDYPVSSVSGSGVVDPWLPRNQLEDLLIDVPEGSLGGKSRPGEDGSLEMFLRLENWSGDASEQPPYQGIRHPSPPGDARIVTVSVGMPRTRGNRGATLKVFLEGILRDKYGKELRVASEHVALEADRWTPLRLTLPSAFEWTGVCSEEELELIEVSILAWSEGKAFAGPVYADDLRFYGFVPDSAPRQVPMFLCHGVQRDLNGVGASRRVAGDTVAARYRVALEVLPVTAPGVRPEWSVPGEVEEGAIFTLHDAEQDIALGLKPRVEATTTEAGEIRVTFEVLTIHHPENDAIRRVIKAGKTTAVGDRPASFRAPDGDGQLQVKVTSVTPVIDP
ncbi:MAG: hypothetical protein AAF604_11275 [Acidobacteriota bacterium]